MSSPPEPLAGQPCTFYSRPRTDPGRLPIAFPDTFRAYDTVRLASQGDRTNITRLFFDTGRILLRFKVERFNLDGTPRAAQFGLDGPSGTGDFRLVLIR